MKNSRLAFFILAVVFSLLPLVAIATEGQNIQSASSTTVNRPTLKIGAKGVEVSELQAALKLLGFYTGTVNGNYGESTAIAVSRFQAAAGLTSDGIVGANTWNRLFPATPGTNSTSSSTSTNTNRPATTTSKPAKPTTTNPPRNTASKPQTPTKPQSTSVDLPILKLGMEGAAVTRLQQRLKSLGFFSSSVTGVFGTSTEAAVKAAQRRFKLEPDGIVGPATWNVLLR